MRKLRILVISNLFPPHYIGGYELGCYDVVEALRKRGHQVLVLTSRYGVGRPRRERFVLRRLPTTLDWSYARPTPGYYFRLLRLEWESQRVLKHVVREYRPDLVYIWSPRFLSMRIAMLTLRMGLLTVFFVSDDWLATWDTDPWIHFCRHLPRRTARRFLKRWVMVLARILRLLPDQTLQPDQVHFTSAFLKRQALAAGLRVDNARVIPWGVDTETFPFQERTWPPRRLLYVGQIVPHKGVHIALDAFHILVHQYGHRNLQLTLVGNHRNPAYRDALLQRMHRLHLQERVHWSGPRPRSKLAETYHAHEILVFPSLWDEPFAITPLEAMSTGMAVVGTTTGGSMELFRHEENALVYPRMDAEACALQIRRLLLDEMLFRKICLNARNSIRAAFAFDVMVDKIERALVQVFMNRNPSQPGRHIPPRMRGIRKVSRKFRNRER